MKRIFTSLVLVLALYLSGSAKDFYKSVGYGYILEFDSDSVQLYDYTPVSLITSLKGKKSNDTILFEHEIFGTILYTISSKSDDSIILRMDGKNYYYSAIDTLPKTKYNDSTANPIECFEILWHTFNENCILFDVAGVNWQNIYTDYKSKITTQTTRDELFNLFAEMLKVLNDNHTNLADFENKKVVPCGNMNGFEWSENQEDALIKIDNYLNQEKKYFSKSGFITSSVIDEKTAYISINSMSGYANEENPSDYESFVSELNPAIENIKNQLNVIVDLRFNGGGIDQISFELVSRFIKEKKIGYYRQVKLNAAGDLSPEEAFYIEPRTPSLVNKKVIVLVSPATASSADVCVMLFKNIPGVTVVGENSNGIFSDMLIKHLPNGFFFSLSNEKYVDEKHLYYEQKGVEPTIRIEPDWIAFAEGKDNMLDSVISILNPATTIENSMTNKAKVNIYQAKGKLFANVIDAPKGQYELTICDASGKTMLKKKFYINDSNTTISIENNLNNKGLYIGVLQNSTCKVGFKIVK